MPASRPIFCLLGNASIGALLSWSIALPAAPVSASFAAGDPLVTGAGFTLNLDPTALADGKQPAFLLGSTDLTALMEKSGDGEYRYPPEAPPLPPGAREMIVYAVAGGEWTEIARLPVKIVTPSGYEIADFNPKLTLASNAQLAGRAGGDAEPLARKTYRDIDLQASLTSEHRRSDFSVRSSANISGYSYRPNALRYSELADDAPKVDLSDYLLEVTRGPTYLGLGHVTFGKHPLLVNSLAHRGFAARHQFGGRFDLGLGLLSGRAIAGYNNFFGLNRWASGRIAAATFGAELLPARPGGLRAELSYFGGEVPPSTDFNTGEAPDAERSHGFGLRVTGGSESGRLRGEINYARSRFNNPQDPNLALGKTAITPVKPSTDNAYSLEMAYAPLQETPLFGDQTVNLTLTVRHARADLFYRSLGALVDANLDSTLLGADANIGPIAAQLAYRWDQDNVDDLPNLLTTRTRGLTFGLNLPLPTLFDGADRAPWLPDVSYALERVHQQAVYVPPPELSGFDDPSQIPDQVTRLDALDFVWTGERWDFSYRLGYGREDNRQPRRENADFELLENRAQLGFRPSDTLNLTLGLGRNRKQDREQALVNYSTDYHFGPDWQFRADWSLNGNLTLTRADDSADLSRNHVSSGQIQIGYRFDTPGPAGRIWPGQWFLRYSLDRMSDRNRAFDLGTRATTWTLLTGLSFTFQ